MAYDRSINAQAPSGSYFAVIDTETNWNDKVMSIGIAIGDSASFKLKDFEYYIIEPEASAGGMYEDRMRICKHTKVGGCSRRAAMEGTLRLLNRYNVSSIFAYNARFDFGHLPELACYDWYDILYLAARREYNSSIPSFCECYSTGRLKRGYGAEAIYRMLSGDMGYCEKHNGLYDAIDELAIMDMLHRPLADYAIAKL